MDEIKAMKARGESQTDWTRFDSITSDELEAMIAGDPDEGAHPDQVWVRVHPLPEPVAGIEPELLAMLPPPGPERDAEVRRIVRAHLKRKAARARRAG
jgi:hypothetical protein